MEIGFKYNSKRGLEDFVALCEEVVNNLDCVGMELSRDAVIDLLDVLSDAIKTSEDARILQIRYKDLNERKNDLYRIAFKQMQKHHKLCSELHDILEDEDYVVRKEETD
jgi:RNAse (barnase) inhibitor barstar